MPGAQGDAVRRVPPLSGAGVSGGGGHPVRAAAPVEVAFGDCYGGPMPDFKGLVTAILTALILSTITAGFSLWQRVVVLETQAAYYHGTPRGR